MAANVTSTTSTQPADRTGIATELLDEIAGNLFSCKIKDSNTFIEMLKELPEIGFYKDEVENSPDGCGLPGDVAEQKRTERSLETLFWIWNGNYEEIVVSQPEEAKLSKESFEDLQRECQDLLSDADAMKTMIVTMLIHDLGKIKWFQDKVAPGENLDHDEVLRRALNESPELLPSFTALPEKYQDIIREGWNMHLNVCQLVQGENSPGNLTEALKIRNTSLEGLKFFIFHEFLDVAGVLGHIPTFAGAFVLDENTYCSYRSAYKALRDLSAQNEIAVYDRYLSIQAEKLGLDSSTKEGRAMTRLCCMSRQYSEEEGEILKQVFNSLNDADKEILLDELNRSGLEEDRAILLYYSPQTLVNLLKKGQKEDALKTGLSLLAKIYKGVRDYLNANPQHGGVYSINIASIANEAASSDNFGSLLERSIAFDFDSGRIHFIPSQARGSKSY